MHLQKTYGTNIGVTLHSLSLSHHTSVISNWSRNINTLQESILMKQSKTNDLLLNSWAMSTQHSSFLQSSSHHLLLADTTELVSLLMYQVIFWRLVLRSSCVHLFSTSLCSKLPVLNEYESFSQKYKLISWHELISSCAECYRKQGHKLRKKQSSSTVLRGRKYHLFSWLMVQMTDWLTELTLAIYE